MTTVIVTTGFDYQSRPTGAGRCSICNTHGQKGERVIRLGEPIEFEGMFDICEGCAREISKAIGWVPPEALASAEARADENAAAEAACAEALASRQEALDVLSIELGYAAQRVVHVTHGEGAPGPTITPVEPDFGGYELTPLAP